MSKTNDGGPALPPDSAINVRVSFDPGSLRDWFTGQALAGIMALPNDLIGHDGTVIRALSGFARVAYEAADAMLKAREAS